MNILLQAYISRAEVEGFALVADMNHVVQSAGRIFRALIRDEGALEERLAEVHAPIGLDLGCRTPEEIAVSIVAELIGDPATLRRRGGPFAGTELDRWDRLTKRHMAATTLPLHRRFSAMNLCFSELGRRAASRRRGDHRLFVSDLVDLTTGLLQAEVSEETLGLLDERERSRDAVTEARATASK